MPLCDVDALRIVVSVTDVINPFPFTVIVGMAVLVPNVPTLELTVARVRVSVVAAVPSKDAAGAEPSPVIEKFLAVANAVAEEALPTKDAVIVPAVKSPLEFLRTTVFGSLDAVELIVIVGDPETPEAFDTESPVPETPIDSVEYVADPVLTRMPVVDIAASAVKSASSGCKSA